MLRLLVLVLILANAGYFAWSQGLLMAYGWAPLVQAEPQRLAQQLRPEAIQLLTSDEARQLETLRASASPASGECLQAGLFNDEQARELRSALQASLPPGSWTLESRAEPGRWILYMGKYANAAAVAKKQSELRQLGVPFQALNNTTLEPGLSLGNFASRAEAEAELNRISARGVRTARLLQEFPEVRGQLLRLAAVTPALRAQLEALKSQLAGKPFLPCAKDASELPQAG